VVVGQDSYHYVISTACSRSRDNKIDVLIVNRPHPEYTGPVEYSTQGAGETTTQSSTSSSSTMTGTAHDSDDDGIPDSSDKCPHNSNTRCYKEG
jgi:hypothetical protein